MMSVKQFFGLRGVIVKEHGKGGKIVKLSKKRQVRNLKMESLEKRELMASDVTAVLSNNTLIIEGSTNSDFVKVFQDSKGSIAVQKNVGGKWFYVNQQHIAPGKVHNIQADMGAGNDRLDINLPQNLLKSINIKLGSGVGDQVNLNNLKVANVTVDAKASLNSNLRVNGSVVTHRLFADFGTESSDDDFTSLFSTIEHLSLEMGGGKDQCTIRNSTVKRATINLGSGDDNFFMSKSSLQSGDIDGGAGRNTRGGSGWGSSVRFRRFVM